MLHPFWFGQYFYWPRLVVSRVGKGWVRETRLIERYMGVGQGSGYVAHPSVQAGVCCVEEKLQRVVYDLGGLGREVKG